MTFTLHFGHLYVSMCLDGKKIFDIRRFYVRYHLYQSSDYYIKYSDQPHFRGNFQRNFRKTFYCLGRSDL